MKPLSVKLSNPPESSFKYKKIELEALEFNWHFHSEYEIMFMSKSKGKRFIGDSISYYKEGDLFLIGPNLPHTWYSPTGKYGKDKLHKAILIQFVENFAGLNMGAIPELKKVQQLFSNAARGFQFYGETRKIVANKILAMDSMNCLEKLINLITVLDILGKANENERVILSSIDFTRSFQPGDQSRIDRVCTFVNQNYKNELCLKSGASIANMSVTAFSRFFKKSTGKTFITFVNELRIGQACKLLIESDLTIAEICYEVGFNNLSNFNRRFCERQAMSPREYRREFVVKF